MFPFLSGVERICWRVSWSYLCLWLDMCQKPLAQMFTLSPTYASPGGLIMLVCVIVAKGDTPSLFPGLFWHNLKRKWSSESYVFTFHTDSLTHVFFVLSQTPAGVAQHSFVLDKRHLELICRIKTEPEFQSVTWQDPLVRSLTCEPQKSQDLDVLQAGAMIVMPTRAFSHALDVM